MGLDLSSLSNRQLNMISVKEREQFGKAALTSEEAAEKLDLRLEGEVEDQIVSYLTLRGVRFIVRQRRDKRTRTKKGTPDLMFSWFNRAVALEVKGPIGKLSPEQEKVRDAMQCDGWIWYLVRNVEEVKKILEAIARVA